MLHVHQVLPFSERRVCRAIGQPRSTQKYKPITSAFRERLTARIIELAGKYGRYGYPRITGLLNNEGWAINHKRVERIWRLEGLKVPKKQPKRGRLWLNDGSCIRLRPDHKDHVWSYDFMAVRLSTGRPLRILNIIDEYTRECLSITVNRQITAQEVLNQLYTLFIVRGVPEHIRSVNGTEFTAKAVRSWLAQVGVKTLFIEPGSP